MNEVNAASKPISFLTIILITQLTLCFSVFLDIGVARQIIGFLYLSFIPGFVILNLLRMDRLGTAESILFSVGLSIAFLMFAGLLINETGLLIGIRTPLSTESMILPMSCFVLLGAALHVLRKPRSNVLDVDNVRIPTRYLLFFVLPILSIVGAFWVNATGNNSILVLMILLVATVFVVGLLSRKIIEPDYYPLVIFCISLAILFHSSLISSYIHGYDIMTEYNVFTATQNSGYWNPTAPIETGFERFSDMLSITIAPTVYSNIMSMDATWILKLVFPVFLSLVPVGVFKIWQTSWGKGTAFISALLLIAQATFYTEMLYLARQIVAELFFVLLLFVLFNKKLDSRSSKFCFMIFGIAIVVSHYGLALIFLFLISGIWLLMLLTRRGSGKVTLAHIVFFAVVMFSWYISTRSGGTFQSILDFGGYVFGQLGSFFNVNSRGTDVARGLGLEAAQSTWQQVSRLSAYATELFIVVGFVSLTIKRKKLKIDWEYYLVLSLGMALLAMTILLPGFAQTLSMTRWYHIALLLLAPFFALGCEAFASLSEKHMKQKTQIFASILMAVILVTYFLFQTNFVYEVVGAPSWSVSLSSYRMDKTLLFGWAGYVDEQSVYGAQWLFRNTDADRIELFGDSASINSVLRSYGRQHQGSFWTNTSAITQGGVLYMSKLNVVYGKILDPTYNYAWNYSELSNQLEFMDKIYSNGGSDVWSSCARAANP